MKIIVYERMYSTHIIKLKLILLWFIETKKMHDHFMRYRWDYETLHVQQVVHARLSTPISVS